MKPIVSFTLDTCIPRSPDSKPKQSRQFKLQKLVKNTPVPSSIGASFFHMVRRYLAGKTAGNLLEERLFPTFENFSPDLRNLLICTLKAFDSLSPHDRNCLFDTHFLGDINVPNDVTKLGKAFTKEIINYASLKVFHTRKCSSVERPGLVRTQPNPGGEFPPSQVLICSINGLRTGQFLPRLAPGDYTLEEVQQTCHMEIDEHGSPKQVCKVQTTNCPSGTAFNGICLRLHEIEAGQSIVLEGMNFSNVDTKVQLMDMAGNIRQFDAFVCGDIETPLTEKINGKKVPIIDCRVHDRLTFRVPEDVIPGQYYLQVFVPNPNHVGGWPDPINSDSITVMVTVPSTARFQISSETLHCSDETHADFLGSDEVGIKIMAIPLFTDLTIGDVQEPNDGKAIRFGNVDTGDDRAMEYILFLHQQPISGVSLLIKGFEIDDEEQFEQEILDYWDSFVFMLKEYFKMFYRGLSGIPYVPEKVAWALAWGLAILQGTAKSAFLALWAPTDPIIADMIGLSALDLLQLTSTEVPLRSPYAYKTVQGITVKVTPLEKTDKQYREKREYKSSDEGSRYQIVLRYNRVA